VFVPGPQRPVSFGIGEGTHWPPEIAIGSSLSDLEALMEAEGFTLQTNNGDLNMCFFLSFNNAIGIRPINDVPSAERLLGEVRELQSKGQFQRARNGVYETKYLSNDKEVWSEFKPSKEAQEILRNGNIEQRLKKDEKGMVVYRGTDGQIPYGAMAEEPEIDAVSFLTKRCIYVYEFENDSFFRTHYYAPPIENRRGFREQTETYCTRENTVILINKNQIHFESFVPPPRQDDAARDRALEQAAEAARLAEALKASKEAALRARQLADNTAARVAPYQAATTPQFSWLYNHLPPPPAPPRRTGPSMAFPTIASLMAEARAQDGPGASVSVQAVLDAFDDDAGAPRSEAEEKRATRVRSFMRELLNVRGEKDVTVRELQALLGR